MGLNLAKFRQYGINRSERPSGGAVPLRRPKRGLHTQALWLGEVLDVACRRRGACFHASTPFAAILCRQASVKVQCLLNARQEWRINYFPMRYSPTGA